MSFALNVGNSFLHKNRSHWMADLTVAIVCRPSASDSVSVDALLQWKLTEIPVSHGFPAGFNGPLHDGGMAT